MFERLARLYSTLAILEHDGSLRPATADVLLGQRIWLDHLAVALPDGVGV
jgi:hypothetical protein